MADIFVKVKRSEVMSRIRGRGNRNTELRMIEVFRDLGIIGWRRKQTLKIPAAMRIGKRGTGVIRPDFLFRRECIVVFVDGEFWHGHPTRAKIPATRHEWWKAKIEGNKKRDRLQKRVLRANGWTVVRIWQHELTKKHLHKALGKLRRVGLLRS
ncbi:MAG: hypothetical protein SFU53_13745 [Terrimicrobiaceae bacterium]|nr:hypothetical protein [Terrimicrobiaceae bacterium]